MRSLYFGLQRAVQTALEPKTQPLYDLADRLPSAPPPRDETQEPYQFVENVSPEALRESLEENARPRRVFRSETGSLPSRSF